MMYWNEWFNDPPGYCDRCNCLGQYVGPGATAPGALPYFASGAPVQTGVHEPAPLEVAEPLK